jgi:GcrA cell cycle regulator
MERKMLWTAEAIEVLKNLALAGRSASVIAATLGEASRNAVIGKANRIGIRLNGDGRAPARGEQSSASALCRAPRRKAAWAFDEAEVQEMRRVGFEDIHEFVCRWPLGDPTSTDFGYCGLKAAKGHSYCAGHCRMAYQPPKATARQGRHAWRRSYSPGRW